MRGSLKVIICFQTRIEKYIENNLPQSYPDIHAIEFHQKVVPRAIEFTTKSDLKVKFV